MTTPIYTPDGRQIVSESPAPDGWDTFITGRGDDPTDPVQNGTGPKIHMDVTDPTQFIEFGFNRPTFLQNGQLFFCGAWSDLDLWSFSVKVPATEFDPGGAQDVAKTPIPGGNAWVPVLPGTGTHSFDQTKAIPIYSTTSPAAVWSLDIVTGDVDSNPAAHPQKAMLLDFAVQSFFVRNVPISGHRQFFTQLYKSSWVSNKHALRWDVSKEGDGRASCYGWLLTYRTTTT